MKKILLYNLITIIVIFVILEIISYFYIKNDAKSFMDEYNKNAKLNGKPLLTQRYAPIRVFNNEEFYEYMRPVNIGDKDKGSILFFGCSYTYGSEEENENTLPYIIYKLTNRTTVNQGVPGGSILNTLFDLNNDIFYKKIEGLPQPEYIVYLYIMDHLNRISNPYRANVTSSEYPVYEINREYKLKNNRYVEKQPGKFILPFYGLYMTKAWFYFYNQKFSGEKNTDKFFNLLKETKRITDEKFPNSKFVILLYKDGGHYTMNEELIDKLKENNFIVLDAEELAGHELDSDEYRAGDKEHPSGKAFKDVAKGLIKELNL